MASARKIVIEFLGKDTSLSRTSKAAGNDVDRLGQRMRRVGKIGALALAGGAVVAGKALLDMGKNAAADEAAQRKLAIGLRNATGATKAQVAESERWIAAQGKALGVTDDELRPALQRFAQVTGDVGKAQKLTSLAMDISAGSGKNLSTVSAALARAQNGNMTGLARLGIATKDAKGETLSLDKVMANAAETFKGQAAGAADSLDGKMARLSLMFDETKETIGAKLIPVVTKLVDWFINKALPAISKFTDYMRDKLGPVFEKIKTIISNAMGSADGDVSSAMTSIKSIIQSAVSIFTSIWQRFGDFYVTYIGQAFSAAKNIIGGALKIIAGIFKTVSALLKGDWKGVWDGIKQIVKGAWQAIKGIVQLGWAAIKLVFKVAGSAIKAVFSGIWKGIKSAARAGMDGLVSAVRSIPGKISALAGKFKSAGKTVLNGLLNGLKGGAGFVSSIAGKIWGAVKGMLNSAIDKINNALEFKIDIPKFKDIHINPPNIPHLARGGVVKARQGGTLALLGEAGADEAVVPLSGRHAPRGIGAGSGVTIIVQGALDPQAVAKQIQQLLLRRKRETGGGLGLA